MIELDDLTLVRACLAGDGKSFASIIDRYQKQVFNVALRMVNDTDDAADITQTVFIKAFVKLKSFNPRFKFFSWLYRIAVNESINHLKSQKPLDDLGEADGPANDGPDQRFAVAEQQEEVQKALMELDDHQRLIILLKHFQGLSYKEIGEILDLPEKKIKSRLYDARQELKKILTNRGFSL